MIEKMRREKMRYISLHLSGVGSPILMPAGMINPEPKKIPTGKYVGIIDLQKHGMEYLDQLYKIPKSTLLEWAKTDMK